VRKNPSAAGRFALGASLAILIACVTPSAHALGLGRLSVNSALGQPLQAEVELTSVTPEEEATLKVNLAPESAYREARLEFNPALSVLRFDTERRGSSVIVRITSLQPVTEPFLDLIVDAAWANGRTRREYTVLLDPPALRQVPQGLPPLASAPALPPPAQNLPPQRSEAAPRTEPPPAPAAEPKREPVQKPEPAPAAAAAPAAPAAPSRDVAAAGTTEYEVKPGDTAGQIARQYKPAAVSLDQMLVAMVRGNPQAFADGNMNRLFAGRRLVIPAADAAASIPQTEARAEVVAQSRDFADYRSRLGQTVATQAAAPATPPAPVAEGKVTPRVEDKSAVAAKGDRLTIAKAEPAASAAAAAATKADEAAAKQRALKEQQERAAELQKTNEALKKALELQSKAGAEAQRKVDAAAANPAPAPAAAEPAKAEAQKADAVKAEASKAEPPPAPATEPAKTDAPGVTAVPPAAPTVEPAPTPAPAPPPAQPAKKAAPPPPPPPAEPGFLEQLLGDRLTQLGLGLLVLLIVGWAGYSAWRKRRVEKRAEFQATTASTTLGASSLFRTSGGRSVDTGSVSTFNSSFIPGASQLDSNEVDPVAEADVYMAYGREEQAEEILKESLRLQPERHAARLKLLEIYSRRGDRATFDAALEQLRQQTGGVGEDWEKGVQLARALNPTNLAAVAAVAAAPQSPGGTSAVEGIAAAYAGLAPEASAALAAKGAAERTAREAERRSTAEPPPLDYAASRGPQTKFEATFGVTQPGTLQKTDAGGDPWRVLTKPVDFSALDFDLKTPTTVVGAGAAERATTPAAAAPPAPPAPTPVPAPTPAPRIPDVDLSLPAAAARAVPEMDLQGAPTRPTVFGARDTASLRQGPVINPPTGQLIDFDLGTMPGVKAGPNTATKSGSPLAAQMGTKLDLARGYVELGVRDGARELLEEVMRDGTPEQRADAVELLRTLEA
jgi:pilus assembly protein FimV